MAKSCNHQDKVVFSASLVVFYSRNWGILNVYLAQLQQIVAFDLGDDEVQLGAFGHGLDYGTLCIALDVLLRLLPLRQGLRLGGCHGQVFQFDDVGVVDVGIAVEVRHQEEVTVPMVQLHLRACR